MMEWVKNDLYIHTPYGAATCLYAADNMDYCQQCLDVANIAFCQLKSIS